MSDIGWFGNNRLICDVLGEMRKCYETRNFAHLLGLVEEAQSYGSRMESALQDQKDFISLQKKISDAKKELKALNNEKESMEEQNGVKKEEDKKE